MRNMNKRILIRDWKISLISLLVGLVITTIAWALTHLSFIFAWLVVVALTIPMWKQIAEKASKRYPYHEVLDAILCYLSDSDDEDEEEDEDSPRLEE